MPQHDITFYCTVNENNWSHHPVAPGKYACIAPVYGRTKRSKTINYVAVPPSTQIILDSGAFSDTTDTRLTFEQALFRQAAHAYRFGYVRQVTHIASYDRLINEKCLVGRPSTCWSDAEADRAVTETIDAAAYISHLRNTISGIFMHPVGVILTAQGIDAEQYLRCAAAIAPMLSRHDVLELGGFAATGLFPGSMLPPFREIIRKVIPYLSSYDIKRIHIWGVCLATALAELLALCKRYGIALSTDSSGPQRRPILGQWGYASWYDPTYRLLPLLPSCKTRDTSGNRAPSCMPSSRCRGLERERHVKLTRAWLARLSMREKELYALADRASGL